MLITKEKLPAILFFIVSEIMYSFELTYLKLPSAFYNVLLCVTFILFVMSFLQSQWDMSKLIKVGIMLLIGLGVYLSSKESLYLMLLFSAIVMNNLSYKEAVKTIFVTRLVMTLLIILSSIVGIIPLNKMVVSKGIFGSALGYGLGYIHPNNLAQAIFVLCSLYLCINYDSIKKRKLVVILLIDAISYEVTKSKTSCIILLIICMLLFLNNDFTSKIIKKFTMPYLSIVIGLSIFGPMLYTFSTGKLQSIVYSLNGYLNGRFVNASNMFISFPITLFGKIINLDYLQRMYGYNVIDNGYVFLLFDYGIIGFLLIVFLYFYSIRKLIQKNLNVFVLIIVGFLSLGMMENVIRAMFMNFTMIFWYEFINSQRNNMFEEKL
ncbi:hypothetical protein BHL89_08470 [Limosilactobacillus reuteri]|uniref:hypothetical protein n=1 Tax=Limosilactobacillus reuteri TaxID=1598 RepID=UPI000A2EBECF|nr:hypothetical protein [Limosilactobacillus reuteri]OTA44625.1 hypothetical protein BHL89_08470 [Limosilactobacillus reuteri]